MKISVLIVILITSLTGCVGLKLTKSGDVVSKSDFSSVDLSYRKAPPARKADKIGPDGTETFRVYDETNWCGLTIWAIIPIPLWLPVCHSYTDVTYKDGKPINTSAQWMKTTGGVCGPLVPLVKMDASGFCQWHDDW